MGSGWGKGVTDSVIAGMLLVAILAFAIGGGVQYVVGAFSG